jgi:hypothetical protein
MNIFILMVISYFLGVLAEYLSLTKPTIKVDLNDLAKEITLQEGKKESVSIAQVKEVMHLLLHKLSKLSREQINYILKSYKEFHKL